jgi:predicted nicotinamide N-methyase
MSDALIALRTSLAEQLSVLRGADGPPLPDSLLDVAIRRVALPGGDVFSVLPVDWEALLHDEGAVGRPIPYWARLWPSGLTLAAAVAADPPARGARVLELGCGLGLPSIVAAGAGASVLATDGSTDAVVFAAHAMALNEVVADVAHGDWSEHSAALEAAGPFDVVLAADVLYTRSNVEAALRLLPRLVARDGVVWLADPGRAGARDLLSSARASFALTSQAVGDVMLHALRRS